MRNWDPFAIFKYLTGIVPMHAAIIIFFNDGSVWEDASLNANFPDQEVMKLKKELLRYMFWSHLLCLLIQCIYDSGLLNHLLSLCCKPKEVTADNEVKLLEGDALLKYKVTHKSITMPVVSMLT